MSISTHARLLSATLCLSLASCVFHSDQLVRGSGNAASETREMGRFERVSVAGSFELDVTAGEEDAARVIVHVDDNLLEYVETQITGDTLKVRIRDGYRISPEARLEIRVADLTGLSIAGSADAEVRGLSGEGFAIEIAGSGSVVAQGAVHEVDVDIAGSGDVRIADLEAREVRVSIAGSGDVELTSLDLLDVDIAGSGDVRYRGSPQIHQRVAGSGSITPR